jgi:biopolymer transport protein TolQ
MSNTLILFTDLTEKLILLALVGLSIWSIGIIIDRWRALKLPFPVDSLKSAILEGNFTKAKQLCATSNSPVAKAMTVAMSVPAEALTIDRAVASQFKEDRLSLEKGLPVLATLGANAPFVGLFGTVLGIIRAFAYLGSQTGSSAVMTGVSQALYATAAGLFVALPAVAAYNLFAKKIREMQTQTEYLKDLYVAQTASAVKKAP